MTGARACSRGPVVVIDDHDLLSSSLVVVMARRGFDVRRVAVESPELMLSQVGRASRGVALVDLDLGVGPDRRRISGLDLIAPLRARGWEPVVLSGTTRKDEIGACLLAGAVGIVSKSSAASDLVATVSTVLEGGRVMSVAERDDYVASAERAAGRWHDADARLAELTERELQVLQRLGDGYRAKAVAEEFSTSITTVRTQIRSILAKLGVGSQLEAVAHLHAAQRP